MSVILNFKVNAGVIRCTSNSTIPANTVKHVRAKFIFEEDWSSYSVKIATFTNEKTGFVRRAILDKENLCVIPWEPLVSGGTLSIDIEGRVSLEDGTSAIARASMEYEIRLIENNVHTDGSEDTIVDTPDILTKALENIELIEKYASEGQYNLPIADAITYDGIAYVARNNTSGRKLPEVSAGSGNHIGKGMQIVFIPRERSNATNSPTLQLNGGEIIPIRVRAFNNQGDYDSRPNATLPVPIGALMVGVPYTMTFCGLYWLVDSQITQFAYRHSNVLRSMAEIAITMTEDGITGMPIVDDERGVKPAYIKRSEEEQAAAAEGNYGSPTLPTEDRVKELTAPCVVNMTKNADGTYTADMTFAELKAAHDAGRAVICSLLDITQEWDSRCRLPVVDTSTVHIGFSGVISPRQGYKIFAYAYINSGDEMGYSATELRNLPESTADDNGKVLTVEGGRPKWATNDPYVDVTAGYNAWAPESGTDKTVENYAKTMQDGRYCIIDVEWHYYVDVITVDITQWRTIRSYSFDCFCVTVYRDTEIAMKIDQELATVDINGTGVITTSHIPLPSKDDKGKVLMASGSGRAQWKSTEQTYTTLTRGKQTATVHCHGLRADKTYKLCLYTASRHCGNKKGAWYHPNNYDVEPVDGKSDHRMGYGKLAGKSVVGKGPYVFPDVPSWMPNDGFLQTEWDVSTDGNIAIQILNWLLPMVKPIGQTEWTTLYVSGFNAVEGGLIGVSNKHFAGLLFRFCLVDSDGTVYPCMDTMTVGCGRWKNADDKLVPRVFVNTATKALIANDSRLYTSIR